MRLVHLQTHLEFEYESISYSLSQQLYKTLTGRTPNNVEQSEEPGVTIRSNKRKEVVDWSKNSCSIIIESEITPPEAFDRTTELFEIVNKIAPFHNLSERRLITNWILPINQMNFKMLERKYRETLMKPQPIWKQSFDSSVILDIKIDNSILHHQSGAMKLEQFRDEYSVFKLNNIPKAFLFLLVQISNNKLIKYSPSDIHDFLTNSFLYCNEHSKLFENIWSK